MSAIDHDTIERVLGSISSTLAAAESHGLLCGLLCAHPSERAKARWFSELLDSTGLEAGQLQAHAHSLQQLDRLFADAVAELNSADLTFELLIPAENHSLGSRTEGLAAWCSGFCAGVGFGVADEQAIPEDSRELLVDFAAISRAQTDETDADEDPLAELTEYVRMGVLLVNEELQPASRAPGGVH